MRICSQYVGLKKVYEMTEFQSFKVSKFQRVAPNSVSGRWIPTVKENPESTLRVGVICPEAQD